MLEREREREMRRSEGKGEAISSLFETKVAKGRVAYRCFAVSVFICICFIWFYRVANIYYDNHGRRWAVIGMFLAELWFGLYWIITQSARWNIIYRFPHKDRLTRNIKKFPAVDIFVCTADHTIEPPSLVMSTILSAMSYNYPPEKLSVYLSDDGGSELTFYALLEASKFAKKWIPFCKKFEVEPRSPLAYFAQNLVPQDSDFGQEWLVIQKLYENMKSRIDLAMKNGTISEDIRVQHTGFSEWSSEVSKQHHQPIVQILIDGRDPNAVDDDGQQLPTLVYMAREKRPNIPHNFKAGAMNALIRVSSEISNGAIILNSDCDMYSNDPDAILEALCFFMDEKQGHKISYVQHPQCYTNNSNNDIYASTFNTINKIELSGIDGFDGALYCGTGCFHRRVSLCGKKYCPSYKEELIGINNERSETDVLELEERSKVLANCDYEDDTQWGKEMGLVYGCPVEDIVTGLTIQCRGWKPVYYNPKKKAFLGVGPITLEQALVQYKRWCEGMFQIFVSKYCPFIYGHGKIKFGAQMGYCLYLLWAPNSFPTLYYVIVPSLCLLCGLPLFPKASSIWFIPFAYVFVSRIGCSIVEALACGDTLKAWWNSQRMWLIRRTTSYFFAFFDTISTQLGFSETTFTITSKVADDDVSKMLEREMLNFGSPSIMFTIIATLALLNFFSLIGFVMRMIMKHEEYEVVETFFMQIVLCFAAVMINLPVYEGLFLRSDKGRFPFSVVLKSFFISSLACLVFAF